MFRIGIIGCGKIAQVRHIPEYDNNPLAQLAGFYDINQERAGELAKRYHGRLYSSVEEMLSDDSIDAVSVCTSNHTHAEIATAALRAGKHVLCEKPMALNLKDCEAMVRTAEETGKQLMIGHNQRIIKGHAWARSLVEKGLIGDVITFRSCFCHGGPESWSIDPGRSVWFFDREKAVLGAMADLGIHKTDLIQFLTGAKVAQVTAVMATLDKKGESGKPIEVEDNAICIYRMDSGVVGTMTASWTCYGKEDNSTVLCGTEGVMKIYADPVHTIIVERKNGEQITYDIDSIQTNASQTSSGVIDMFVESLETGKAPAVGGGEALSAMRAVFAAVESARTGKTVEVLREG